ncbi:MAG: hypothetical protein WDN45_18935 [Caulobacteraceae bacterium]
MTVAEALAAHACAQMAAARAADETRRLTSDLVQVELGEEPRSFIEGWAISATVIGLDQTH